MQWVMLAACCLFVWVIRLQKKRIERLINQLSFTQKELGSANMDKQNLKIAISRYEQIIRNLIDEDKDLFEKEQGDEEDKEDEIRTEET
jgi:hypothetical protein